MSTFCTCEKEYRLTRIDQSCWRLSLRCTQCNNRTQIYLDQQAVAKGRGCRASEPQNSKWDRTFRRKTFRPSFGACRRAKRGSIPPSPYTSRSRQTLPRLQESRSVCDFDLKRSESIPLTEKRG